MASSNVARSRVVAGDVVRGHVVVHFRTGLVRRDRVGHLKSRLDFQIKSFPYAFVFALLLVLVIILRFTRIVRPAFPSLLGKFGGLEHPPDSAMSGT